MKKMILFLTTLCMAEADARCPLYAELTTVLVVQGKLTLLNHAAVLVQRLGLGTLLFKLFKV